MLVRANIETLATRLQALRKERGFSQQVLAELTDGAVSAGWIAQVEREKIGAPRYEKLLAVAKALNVDVEWLVGDLVEEEKITPEEIRFCLPMGVRLDERQVEVLRKIMVSIARELSAKGEQHDAEAPEGDRS